MSFFELRDGGGTSCGEGESNTKELISMICQWANMPTFPHQQTPMSSDLLVNVTNANLWPFSR